MFKETLSDPTAGKGAQLRRLHPEVPQPVLDPTDPRYGSVAAAGKRDDVLEEAGPAAAERPRPHRL